MKKFGIKQRKENLQDWKQMVNVIKNAKKKVKIALVGKYFETGSFTLADSYISVIEAIKHAAWFSKVQPEFIWFSAESYEKNPEKLKELKNFNGVVVPGGFGGRGVEGIIKAIGFCRQHKIPYLGLCFGMQLAVVEFARNICGMKNADTTEIAQNCPFPVIDVMPEQKSLLREKKYGATMRLGEYPCLVRKGTKAFASYAKAKWGEEKTSGDLLIQERHRHRYEVNNEFRSELENQGLVISGINQERDLVEIIELKNHPFFVASQFHPEFKSRPLGPHPLFREFIVAALRKK